MVTEFAGRCLLARQKKLAGRPSLLPWRDFVEPGESAEEAVVREVREESGLEVRGRPLPRHPSRGPIRPSLMLGYFAVATHDDLVIDREELAGARWFTREETGGASRPVSNCHAAISIARALIDAWIARGIE